MEPNEEVRCASCKRRRSTPRPGLLWCEKCIASFKQAVDRLDGGLVEHALHPERLFTVLWREEKQVEWWLLGEEEE